MTTEQFHESVFSCPVFRGPLALSAERRYSAGLSENYLVACPKEIHSILKCKSAFNCFVLVQDEHGIMSSLHIQHL